MQARLNLLAQELHRPHDLLVRNQTAGVELSENTGEAHDPSVEVRLCGLLVSWACSGDRPNEVNEL